MNIDFTSLIIMSPIPDVIVLMDPVARVVSDDACCPNNVSS